MMTAWEPCTLHSKFEIQACVCTIHAWYLCFLEHGLLWQYAPTQKFGTHASTMSNISVTKGMIMLLAQNRPLTVFHLIWSSLSALLTSVPWADSDASSAKRLVEAKA